MPPANSALTPDSAPSFRRVAIALFAAGFAVFAQIFGAQAMLPAISDDFDLGASAAALTVSAATLGVAASVLIWAWIADRIGRVQAMKISIVTATAIAFVVPILPTFETMIIARVALGVALGAVPAVSVAYLAEGLAASRVAVAAGIFVSGNTFGGITGRLLGGPLSEIVGWRTAMLVIAGLSVIAAITFLVLIPRTRRPAGGDTSPYPMRTRILFQLRDPVMLGLYAQGFFLMGSFGAIYNYLGYRLELPPYEVPATLVGLLFTAYLFGTAASRFAGGRVARFGALRVILAGITLMLVGLALLLSPTLIGVIAGLVIFTVGCFTAHPVASGQSGVRAQLGRSQATALYQLSWLGGTALFGWLAGVVFDEFGWPWTVAFVAVLGVLAALFAALGLRVFADRRPVVPAR
ncbi:putative MFS family arabinose efflux permease [Glaciihabitans tibetensis]|uniref:Putative MFS family arabinose efflux permease n=1 Tax=Glaciihabitans tibetensis TaxID=1266600 RepID=A0A2T0VDY3_9MICO|nr:MFS transporter [Glaciihabitans tibetensis]PRY68397.1 putative MFS family arabinose efflux permease [Glaciihabitans tibetensis]